MKPTLLIAFALLLAAGCASETDAPIDEPVVGEAEAVTEVEMGPVDDSLIVPEDTLIDPTYVPDEESVEGEMTEGEMLDPGGRVVSMRQLVPCVRSIALVGWFRAGVSFEFRATCRHARLEAVLPARGGQRVGVPRCGDSRPLCPRHARLRHHSKRAHLLPATNR